MGGGLIVVFIFNLMALGIVCVWAAFGYGSTKARYISASIYGVLLLLSYVPFFTSENIGSALSDSELLTVVILGCCGFALPAFSKRLFSSEEHE